MYKALNFAHNFDGPVCVRFPRGKSEIEEFVSYSTIELGKGNIVKTGKDTAIFAFGNMLEIALEASEKINATVVDMRFVKPLDKALIIEIANNSKVLISIEDNTVNGGAGSAINELLQENNINTPLKILGVPDKVTEHGSQSELYELYGLTSENIINVSKNK
jgi:1-deoxy-D-xylulose-5-phosphate synthase